MRGAGGLDAINGAMDGNLTQWAEGEALSQVADQQPPHMGYSPPEPMSRSVLAGLLLVIGVLLLIAFH